MLHLRFSRSLFTSCLFFGACLVSGFSLSSSEKRLLIPVFDFKNSPSTKKNNAFERIDDTIMGGVSSSTLVVDENIPYAKWFGICRTDGGGFCGVRTLPFKNGPLNATVPGDSGATADGVYLKIRLVSDNESDRRVWKVTTRVKPNDRGEQLYQAMYQIPNIPDSENYTTIAVPFDDFRLVRGPNLVPGGPPLDVSQGLYQVGLTMSRFPFGEKPLKNFREGFFEVHVQEIGFYSDSSPQSSPLVLDPPEVLSKDEARKRIPLIVKILLPISRVFFTEQSRRRRAAMNVLMKRYRKESPNEDVTPLQKLGFRWKALRFGWKSRKKVYGNPLATIKTFNILAVDTMRTLLGLLFRVLILPVRLLRTTMKLIKN